MSSVKKLSLPSFSFDDDFKGKDQPASAELAERVRAAARAALKRKPAGVATVFLESPSPKKSEPRTTGADASSPENSADDSSSNPLAALLSYTDDSSDSEDSSPQATPPRDVNPRSGNKDNMDEELLNFMTDLKSCGLLEEMSYPPDGHATSGTSSSQQKSSSKGDTKKTSADASAAASTSGSSNGAAAEQKVLGYLVGAPAWCKVEDTGSGKIYFWNMSTNDVAWDAPQGADPDDLRSTSQLASDAASAESAATQSRAAAGHPQQQGGDSGAAGTAAAGKVEGSSGPAAAGHNSVAGAVGTQDPLVGFNFRDGLLERQAAATGNSNDAPGTSTEPLLPVDAAIVMAALQQVVDAAQSSADSVLAHTGPALSSLLPLLELLVEAKVRLADWRFACMGEEPRVYDVQDEASRAGAAERVARRWARHELHTGARSDQLRSLLPGIAVAALAAGQAAAAAGGHPKRDAADSEPEDGKLPEEPPPLPEDHPHTHTPPLPSQDDGPSPPPPSSPPPPLPSEPTSLPPGALFPNPLLPNAAPPLPGTSAHEALEFLASTLAATTSAAAAAPPAGLRNLAYSSAPVLAGAASSSSAPPNAKPAAVDSESSAAAALAAAAAAAATATPTALPGSSSSSSTSSSTSISKKVKSKKVLQLIDKWTAVQRDQDEQDQQRAKRAAEAADPEAVEKRRKTEIQAWKAEQLRSGHAEANANFQPLHGDWRQRVKAQGSSAGGAASSEGGKSSAGKSQPDLEALSAGLPKGWRAMWDKASRDVYYGNLETKEVSWDRPK